MLDKEALNITFVHFCTFGNESIIQKFSSRTQIQKMQIYMGRAHRGANFMSSLLSWSKLKFSWLNQRMLSN